ncbi:MAG: hypothetical protein RL172_90 [Bacteroidota bacterium]
MAKTGNHINYTAADISRYIAGQMTPAEMHAIESAALDDPLLADAIEGYLNADSGKDWAATLASLHKNFAQPAPTKVVPLSKYKWLKAAAAIILIGSTIAITYLINANRGTQPVQIAQTNNSSTDSLTAAQDNSEAAALDSTLHNHLGVDKKSESAPADNIKSDIAKTSTQNQPAAASTTNNDFVYTPAAKPAEQLQKDRSTSAEDIAAVSIEKEEPLKQHTLNVPSNNANTQNNETAYNGQALNMGKKETFTKAVTAKVPAHPSQDLPLQQFSGQVLDNNGEPLSFASINIQNGKQQFITDAKGNFSISVNDTILNMVVSSAGYLSNNAILNNPSGNKIQLQPGNTAISEVVVTGVARDKTKKRINSLNAEIDETAEPEGGWDMYNQYITQNLQIPGNVTIKGEVEALVKINQQGEIAAIKITRSLNRECDKEAIRVIKTGPAWKVKKGKKGYGRVKVRFLQ